MLYKYTKNEKLSLIITYQILTNDDQISVCVFLIFLLLYLWKQPSIKLRKTFQKVLEPRTIDYIIYIYSV